MLMTNDRFGWGYIRSSKFFLSFFHEANDEMISLCSEEQLIHKSYLWLLPSVDLNLIFEISNLPTWYLNLMFCLFQTGFLQATQAVKVNFEIDKKSSSIINFENQFHELEILKIKCRSTRLRKHSFMTSDVFWVFLTYLPTQIRCFTT